MLDDVAALPRAVPAPDFTSRIIAALPRQDSTPAGDSATLIGSRVSRAFLAAAAGLIAHNSGRLGKTLWTDVGDGHPVKVIGVWDGPEEARRFFQERRWLFADVGDLEEVECELARARR